MNVGRMGRLVLLAIGLWAMPPCLQAQESGYQVIQGTRVFTQIDHASQAATFSNDCGRQTISRRDLQAGAIPDKIIPCPRPAAASRPAGDGPPRQRLWSAVAAGIDNGFLGVGSKASVGLGQDYPTRAEAERAAVLSCQQNVSSCKVVTAWNAGCYYITVSEHGDNVAWGAGPTAQEAYNECYKHVRGGNCKTQTLGGCYSQ